jgi:hypothetical protein
MKAKLIFACLSLAMVAPVAQAAIVSIDDNTESLGLFVALQNKSTSGGEVLPGTGTPIDIATPTSSNGIDLINYNASLETLSFRFANQINWGGDVYYYRYFTGPEGQSDLFVIQGLKNTAPDYITFISDPGRLTGNITDIVPLLANSTATPQDLGALSEGGWQLAFNTGVDQYYVRSDVTTPEPNTLTVFGTGIAAMALLLRRGRRNRRD